MKRKLPFILLLSSILTLTACSDTEVSSNILDKEGIAPYELSEKDQNLLASFGITDNAQIISFRAPAEAATLQVSVYQSNNGSSWEKIGGGAVSIGTSGKSPDQLSGTFTMRQHRDHSMEFHLDCSGHFSFETEPITFGSESVGSTMGFLESFENIELNAEIPVAVMLCGSGTRMPGCTPQDYFDPSKFEGIDFAQAVTLEFSD